MKETGINAAKFRKSRNPGKCIYCNSENTDVDVLERENRIGIFFKCSNCGNFNHFDAIKSDWW